MKPVCQSPETVPTSIATCLNVFDPHYFLSPIPSHSRYTAHCCWLSCPSPHSLLTPWHTNTFLSQLHCILLRSPSEVLKNMTAGFCYYNCLLISMVIRCRDSNQILFPFLDQSPASPTFSQTKLSCLQLLNKHNLVDSWQETLHLLLTSAQDILADWSHFLMIGLVAKILVSTIIPFTWSVHNSVYTSIAFPNPTAHNTTWCLNDTMLKNQAHCLDIELALKDNSMHNTSPDVSPLTVWKAHKPVIHGEFTPQAMFFKRQRKVLCRKL